MGRMGDVCTSRFYFCCLWVPKGEGGNFHVRGSEWNACMSAYPCSCQVTISDVAYVVPSVCMGELQPELPGKRFSRTFFRCRFCSTSNKRDSYVLPVFPRRRRTRSCSREGAVDRGKQVTARPLPLPLHTSPNASLGEGEKALRTPRPLATSRASRRRGRGKRPACRPQNSLGEEGRREMNAQLSHVRTRGGGGGGGG